MKLLGFSFTKISAEKEEQFGPGAISTDIKFTNFAPEKLDFLQTDAAKISFSYKVTYSAEKEEKSKKEDKETKEREKHGEITMNGFVLLNVTKEEMKNISKSWKKQELPNEFKVPLYNIILRRCTPKAIHLQDELSLPFHTPMPRLQKQQ